MNKFVVPGKFKQIEGSVLLPHFSGLRLILNLTSVSGKVDTTLETKLTTKWAAVKKTLKQVFVDRVNCKLGHLEHSMVDSETWVSSLYCLDTENKFIETAFDQAFKKIVAFLKTEKASLHVSNTLFNDFPEIKDKISQLPLEGINLYFYNETNQH